MSFEVYEVPVELFDLVSHKMNPVCFLVTTNLQSAVPTNLHVWQAIDYAVILKFLAKTHPALRVATNNIAIGYFGIPKP